jgi:tripartite-type tricarboxylate transporter receptor subunit TctC
VISEFAPIIMPAHTDGTGQNRNPASTVCRLIALAKQPGFPYAGGVSGSPMHVLGEQFKKAAMLISIPYKSVADSVTAVIGGQINVVWMPTSGNLQYFKAGMLRALATAAPTRSPSMPEVPTMIELGYKNIEAKAWFGLLAPRATPIPVIARLNKEVNAILALPDVREKIIPAGYEPEGGGSEVLAAQMREDDARYRKLVAEYGIRAN